MRFADAALEADFRRYHLAEFLPRMRRSVPVALALFLIGTILFSGSLYRMALTDLPLFAGAAPIGGTSFILGWLALAAAGFVRSRA